MDLDEGATRDRDPEKIVATGGCGRALARRGMGEGKEMRAGPGRQPEREKRVRSGDQGG